MHSSHLRRLPALLLMFALFAPAYADDYDPSGQQISTNTSNLAMYLLNLGSYLGYNLTQQPPANPSPLMPITLSQLVGSNMGANNQPPFYALAFDAFLGAIPINALFPQFVPSSITIASSVNAFANATFPSYNSASTQTNAVTVNSAIDQPTYQQDPVSQSILNILATPDISNCMDTNTKTLKKDCKLLFQNKVKSNVIGQLPDPDAYYTSDYNQQFLNQLNSNALTAPLLYSTNGAAPSTSSSPQTTPAGASRLSAQNQLQEAANFIRYATGAVAPLSLPQQDDYGTLYAKALNIGNSTSPADLNAQVKAQSILNDYFAKLRVYAAQVSVGYSNLYYILSKRIPQSTGASSSSTPTSQALTEFTMASWRLYNPGGSTNTDWLNQINQASSATVQKEIVTLLAEINYQLYLSRQQEERMLLTNTMLLLLNARVGQPAPPTASGGATPQ